MSDVDIEREKPKVAWGGAGVSPWGAVQTVDTGRSGLRALEKIVKLKVISQLLLTLVKFINLIGSWFLGI